MIADTLAELKVPIGSVRAYGRNPHRGDVVAIKRSLEVNGQYRPIVVNRRTSEVLAGNHTWLAVRELGWAEIAATFVDVDDEQAARIVLADNRTAELGGYADQELAELLASLLALDGTGWQERELERLLARLEREGVDAGRDTEPGPRPARPRTKAGQLYRLGAHRLICGDAADVTTIERLLDGELVEMVWTDPPYGVGYVGKTAAALTMSADRRGNALGETVRMALELARERTRSGGAIYLTHGEGIAQDMRAIVDDAGWEIHQVLVWVKDQFVLGRQDYHWQHEPILYGWKPGGAHRWLADRSETTVIDDETDLRELDRRQLVALIQALRNERRTTVIREDRPRRSDLHPTMKPVGLVARCLLNSSRTGGSVYDPFAGSGTTLIACENLGRRGFAVELDRGYCDVIVDRWQRHTGLEAAAG